MEFIFCGIFYIIGMIFRIIGGVFWVLWTFNYNPVLEKGSKSGYLYEPWDYKLWDWVFYGNKPQHRGVK